MRSALLHRITAFVVFATAATAAHGQDNNFHLPMHEIEARIRSDTFRIIEWRGSRRAEDRTQRVTIEYPDSMVAVFKWANAPRGGSAFNNEPRYEMAAYEVQKLFLDPEDYVVPPTIVRAFPIEFVREYTANIRPTFDAAPQSVLVALQYWMSGVRQTGVWSPERLRHDTAYARRIGNFNILTHLIRHRDSNVGNFLISTDTTHPRIYSVDNGVAFESDNSDRGDEWRFMRVNRLPRLAIEKMAALTPEQIDEALGVLAEFEIRDGVLVPVERSANLSPTTGIRVRDGRVQIGLTRREIRDIQNRVNDLVRQAQNGRYRLF